MNDKQKIFAIVGTIAFFTWLFLPVDEIISLDDIFSSRLNGYWFENLENVLSFAVAIGCYIGFFLFKDEK